jgi:Fe-S-cluster containining protein
MTYRALLEELDRWFARGVHQAGPGVVLCRAGCSACCHGPFDISPADARLIADAVAALPEPARIAITGRAARQVGQYPAHLPGWQAPWSVAEVGDDQFDALGDALAAEPCPALDQGGRCLVYESRPATCRMTGLAMIAPNDDRLENICPILETSEAYAALDPVLFELAEFEDAADLWDVDAEAVGWFRTTIAGALVR